MTSKLHSIEIKCKMLTGKVERISLIVDDEYEINSLNARASISSPFIFKSDSINNN